MLCAPALWRGSSGGAMFSSMRRAALPNVLHCLPAQLHVTLSYGRSNLEWFNRIHPCNSLEIVWQVKGGRWALWKSAHCWTFRGAWRAMLITRSHACHALRMPSAGINLTASNPFFLNMYQCLAQQSPSARFNLIRLQHLLYKQLCPLFLHPQLAKPNAYPHRSLLLSITATALCPFRWLWTHHRPLPHLLKLSFLHTKQQE